MTFKEGFSSYISNPHSEVLKMGYYKLRHGESAPLRYLEGFLEQKQVVPKFEHQPGDREKLFSESGVVFANHPRGMVDAAIVLKALEDPNQPGKLKPKLRIIVKQESYNLYSKFLDPSMVVPAVMNRPKELLGVLNGAANHINSGGTFVIFSEVFEGNPDKYYEEPLPHSIEFEPGLTWLMGKIDPEKMAYSLSINPRQVNLNNPSNPHKTSGPVEVRVKEAYSTCREWQELMDGVSGRTEKTQAIAKHYFDIHSDNLN